jgi:hypothetical protein
VLEPVGGAFDVVVVETLARVVAVDAGAAEAVPVIPAIPATRAIPTRLPAVILPIRFMCRPPEWSGIRSVRRRSVHDHRGQ